MKIQRYIGVLVVLAVGLLLVNASFPEATFAQAQATTFPACVQCYAPVNAWSVPATAGAATPVCPTYAPSATAPARPVAVKATATPWDALGSILALPFEVAQCVLAGCP